MQYLLTLLTLTTRDEIDGFLNGVRVEFELPEFTNDYLGNAKVCEEKARKAYEVQDANDYIIMSALYSLAHYKTETIPHAATADPLEEAQKIGNTLVEQAIKTIDEKFGKDYALKNPHVFGNVLNTFRSAYTSMQEKNKR